VETIDKGKAAFKVPPVELQQVKQSQKRPASDSRIGVSPEKRNRQDGGKI